MDQGQPEGLVSPAEVVPPAKLAVDFVPNTHRVSVQVLHDIPFEAICSFTDKPFSGAVRVEVHPHNRCMEYCSVGDFIRAFKGRTVTHEQIAREVWQAVKNAVQCGVIVTVDVLKSEAHDPATVVVRGGK